MGFNAEVMRLEVVMGKIVWPNFKRKNVRRVCP